MLQSRGVLRAFGGSNALPLLFKLVHHLRSDIGSSGMAGQKISRWKEKAFEGFGVRRDVANQIRVLRRSEKVIGGLKIFFFQIQPRVNKRVTLTDIKRKIVNRILLSTPKSNR